MTSFRTAVGTNSNSMQALTILVNHVQHIYDRYLKSANSLIIRRKMKIVNCILIITFFAVATGAFLFHAYKTVGRFVKRETQQSVITQNNESLPLPVVSLGVLTYRNYLIARPRPPLEMRFSGWM